MIMGWNWREMNTLMRGRTTPAAQMVAVPTKVFIYATRCSVCIVGKGLNAIVILTTQIYRPTRPWLQILPRSNF